MTDSLQTTTTESSQGETLGDLLHLPVSATGITFAAPQDLPALDQHGARCLLALIEGAHRRRVERERRQAS